MFFYIYRRNALELRLQKGLHTGSRFSLESEMTEGKETTARQYLYVEEQHANSTLSRLNDLRNERGSLCDVSIAAESEDSASVGRRIFAHRAVLAASSPYFKAMFTADMLESRSSVVKIHGVEADTLAALIDVRIS